MNDEHVTALHERAAAADGSAMSTEAYRLPEGNVALSISGGRTSGYMLRRILDEAGPLPERCVVAFMNTGREMPETLDFVAEMETQWGVPIVWLEYLDERPWFRVVSHATASADGEPFAAMVRRRKLLPNVVTRFCTSELKIRPLSRYLRSLGWEHWSAGIGIRADEPRRLKREPSTKSRETLWYPLADAGVTSADVLSWWESNGFDLQLPTIGGRTWLGNCDGCFLKSEAARAMLVRDYPERAAWWEGLEAEFKAVSRSTFSKRWNWASLAEFIDRQGKLAFWTSRSGEGLLCQQSDGECSPHA